MSGTHAVVECSPEDLNRLRMAFLEVRGLKLLMDARWRNQLEVADEPCVPWGTLGLKLAFSLLSLLLGSSEHVIPFLMGISTLKIMPLRGLQPFQNKRLGIAETISALSLAWKAVNHDATTGCEILQLAYFRSIPQ